MFNGSKNGRLKKHLTEAGTGFNNRVNRVLPTAGAGIATQSVEVVGDTIYSQ